ncbi:MAG: NAD-dependent epimerase/dehydratase family protein [bacterium]|nr:NAD-dependent epimerase/dehydratase family protein [bacterium]
MSSGVVGGDTVIDWPTISVVVTRGAGSLGRFVCAELEKRSCRHVHVPRRRDYDLTREADVARMYDCGQPEVVVHLTAEVSGIGAIR